MQSDDQLLCYAKVYHQLGWFPIPVNQKKIPLIKWQKDWMALDRWPDEEEIEMWFDHGGLNAVFPDLYGIALFCGPKTNLWVLDVDVKHGDGMKTLKELQGDEPELNTWSVETKSGGRHYYFSDANLANKVGVYPHIDVRGQDGGVAFAPPTPGYRWIAKPGNYPAAPPEWIKRAFQLKPKPLPSLSKRALAMSGGQKTDAYWDACLENRFNGLSGLHDGRKTELYKAACRLGDGPFSVEEAIARLLPASDLPASLAEQTIRNAYRYRKGKR